MQLCPSLSLASIYFSAVACAELGLTIGASAAWLGNEPITAVSGIATAPAPRTDTNCRRFWSVIVTPMSVFSACLQGIVSIDTPVVKKVAWEMYEIVNNRDFWQTAH